MNQPKKKLNLCRHIRYCLLLLLLLLVCPQTVRAYPDQLKFDVALTATPDQLLLQGGDRFLLVRSKASGLVRLVDLLGFTLSSTILPGGSPYGACLNATGDNLYMTVNNNQLVSLDVSDPLNLPAVVSSDLVPGGQLQELRCAAINNVDYVYLWNADTDDIVVYNATDEVLLNGDLAASSLDLTDDVIDFRINAASGLLFVLRSNGLLEAYDALGLYFKDSVDLKAVENFSETMDLVGLRLANIPGAGYLAFAVNNIRPGEIYIVNFDGLLSTGFMVVVDADSGAGSAIDPLYVADDPVALGVGKVKNPESGETEADYAAVLNSAGSLEWIDLADVLTDNTLEPFSQIETAVNAAFDGLIFSSSDDGYLYLADKTATRLRVVSENPEVTIVSHANPSGISTGGSTSFTFRSDRDGTYQVRLNGYTERSDTITTNQGESVESGSLDAGQEITVTADDSFDLVEGDNFLTVFVTDGDLTGRNRTSFIFDLPPPAVSGFKVDFGNEKVIVRFKSLEQEDTDHYNLYFGPTADNLGGIAGLTSPVTIAHPGPYKTVEYRLQPIPNGTEVFAKLAAVDQQGNIGPFTETLSTITEETVGILALTGETGGCGTLQRGAAGFLLCLAGALLLLLALRRRYWLGLSLLMVMILFPAAAQAAEKSPRDYAVDILYNFYLPYDTVLHQFFGDFGNDLITARFGYFVWDDINLGLELGLMLEDTYARGVTSGRKSGEKITLTYVPINFDLQYRFNILPFSWLTPILGLGFGMNYYDLTEESGSVSGLKFSMRPNASLIFRMERLTRDIARLDEMMGINSLYLHLRAAFDQQLSGTDGLDFSAWEFGVGIGFEL